MKMLFIFQPGSCSPYMISLWCAAIAISVALPIGTAAAQSAASGCRPFPTVAALPGRTVRDLAHAAAATRSEHGRTTWRHEMVGVDSAHGHHGEVLLPLVDADRVQTILGAPAPVTALYAVPASSPESRWWMVGVSDRVRVALVNRDDLRVIARGVLGSAQAIDLFPPREGAPAPEVDCAKTFTEWCHIVSVRTVEGSRGALILGLRENEGYGGGFGTFDQTVVLFLRGDAVVTLATIRTAYDVMIAGEWNRNGTRGHTLWDGALGLEWLGAGEAPPTVIVRPQGHAGRRRVAWDESQHAYGCGPSTPRR